MNYFIADTHFGHEGSIRFDNRPYSCVEEMDKAMIELWNGRVTGRDNVYILGDFAFYKDVERVNDLLRTLKGKKHLIRGNHDRFVDNPSFDSSLFVWIKDYYRMMEGKHRLILFHYPIAVWDCDYRGAIHLYGHVHIGGFNYDRFPQLRELVDAYNACAAVNNFMPCTLQEIIINNWEWIGRYYNRVDDMLDK